MHYLHNIIPIFFPLLLLLLLFILIPIINGTTTFKCKNISKERIDILEEVAKKGHPNTAFMLTAKEYGAIIHGGGCGLTKKSIKIFKENMKGLRKRMNKFAKNFEQIKEIKFDEIDHQMLDNLQRNGKLAIECKKLLMEILSEYGEGIRINIFSFIKMDESKEFKWLEKCEKISKLQSPDLDEMINEDLLMQHLANTPKKGTKMRRRVVVEGGGPIGLLTTFRLFLAGLDVTMVEGRNEYSRRQVVFLDAIWIAQMAYLLGTKYDELVGENNNTAFGRVWKNQMLISIKYLEKMAKSRLEEFTKFLRNKKEKTNDKDGPTIELIYGFNIVDIEHPISAEDPNFYAILKLKNSKEKKEKNHMSIPFDFFICAGGAGDQMRKKFGMEISIHSDLKKYGTSRLLKQNGENAIISEDPFNIPGEEVQKWIEKAKFEKVMENIEGIEKLSQNIQRELEKLGEELAKSTQELSGVLETRELFSTSYIVPKPLENILRMIEEEKKGQITELDDGMKMKMMMDKLAQRIMAKWTFAIFGYFYDEKLKPKFYFNINENGEPKEEEEEGQNNRFSLNFDKSSSIFDLQIRVAHKVAVELENKFTNIKKGNSVAFVLGDALVSPHFYTGTGMSTGRMGVEFLAEKLKMFNLGQIEGIGNLMNQVNAKMDFVKEKAVEWASVFIETKKIPKGKQKQSFRGGEIINRLLMKKRFGINKK